MLRIWMKSLRILTGECKERAVCPCFFLFSSLFQLHDKFYKDQLKGFKGILHECGLVAPQDETISAHALETVNKRTGKSGRGQKLLSDTQRGLIVDQMNAWGPKWEAKMRLDLA